MKSWVEIEWNLFGPTAILRASSSTAISESLSTPILNFFVIFLISSLLLSQTISKSKLSSSSSCSSLFHIHFILLCTFLWSLESIWSEPTCFFSAFLFLSWNPRLIYVLWRLFCLIKFEGFSFSFCFSFLIGSYGFAFYFVGDFGETQNCWCACWAYDLHCSSLDCGDCWGFGWVDLEAEMG